MNRFLVYAGTTLMIVLLLRVIRSFRPDFGVESTLATVVFLSGIALSISIPIIDYINNLAEQYSVGYLSVLWKAVGISFVTATTSDLCRSSNEEAIAAKIELIGKIELLLLSLPLIQELALLMLNVLEGVR